MSVVALNHFSRRNLRTFLNPRQLAEQPPHAAIMHLYDTKSRLSASWIEELSSIVRDYHREIWTASAIVSILTSRHLLVELNVHFPLHLHLVQLATATLITAALHLHVPRLESLAPSSRRVTCSQWLLLCSSAVVAALSMVFFTQAIMHYQNLPTLVMLTAVAWCDEASILLFISKSRRSRLEMARISIVVLCCIGMLVSEYRLLVAGLLTAIPAVHLAGAARALRQVVADRMPGMMDTGRMNILLCCAGFAVTGTCAAYRTDETWDGFLNGLRLETGLVLSINALATAVAMLLGQSILFPMDNVESGPDIFPNYRNWSDMTTTLLMTGAIGLATVLKLRRPYTSSIQCAFFGLAVAFIGYAPCVTRFWNRHKYDVVPNTIELDSVYSDDTAFSDASDITRVADTSEHLKSVYQRAFLGFVLPFIWILYLVLNFSGRIYPAPAKVQPILDRGYTGETAVEIVISMYKEPVDEVADVISTLKAMPNLRSSQVHIYTKDNEIDIKQLKIRTGANNVTLLPNIGREGETYLHHILDNWDTLARQTVFLQAEVHNPREFYPRIRDYFDPVRTGMLSLGWSGQVCSCEDCGDRFGYWDTAHLFPKIHNLINNSTQCGNVLLSYKGQFIVSSKRIRGVDKSVYRDLHDAFVNKDSWAHQEEFVRGRPDSMSAPIFGFTMERIWNLLFQCNDMHIAWKCASLLSGNRIGGNIEDCQCFDPVLVSTRSWFLSEDELPYG